jgi:NAD+ synthase (glutamine-hydrolysing)
MEVYNIQVQALVQRLSSSKISKVVIGVSGGLDSTHALLVCAKAMDRLGLPRSNILAYTMPGFATSDRTLQQARELMKLVGCTAREIDIRPSCLAMLRIWIIRIRAASRSTTSRSRTCRPASAPTTCSGWRITTMRS